MKYLDYVIKDGKFIGQFEEMYKNVSDPWKLLSKNKSKNLNYMKNSNLILLFYLISHGMCCQN